MDPHVVLMRVVRINELGWIYNVCVLNDPWQPWPAQPIEPDRTYFKAAQPAPAGSGASKKAFFFHSFYPISYYLSSHDDTCPPSVQATQPLLALSGSWQIRRCPELSISRIAAPPRHPTPDATSHQLQCSRTVLPATQGSSSTTDTRWSFQCAVLDQCPYNGSRSVKLCEAFQKLQEHFFCRT
jgi:hypothetical protein